MVAGVSFRTHHLADRTPAQGALDVAVERLPAAVEAIAYFAVDQTLTNVAPTAA